MNNLIPNSQENNPLKTRKEGKDKKENNEESVENFKLAKESLIISKLIAKYENKIIKKNQEKLKSLKKEEKDYFEGDKQNNLPSNPIKTNNTQLYLNPQEISVNKKEIRKEKAVIESISQTSSFKANIVSIKKEEQTQVIGEVHNSEYNNLGYQSHYHLESFHNKNSTVKQDAQRELQLAKSKRKENIEDNKNHCEDKNPEMKTHIKFTNNYIKDNYSNKSEIPLNINPTTQHQQISNNNDKVKTKDQMSSNSNPTTNNIIVQVNEDSTNTNNKQKIKSFNVNSRMDSTVSDKNTINAQNNGQTLSRNTPNSSKEEPLKSKVLVSKAIDKEENNKLKKEKRKRSKVNCFSFLCN